MPRTERTQETPAQRIIRHRTVGPTGNPQRMVRRIVGDSHIGWRTRDSKERCGIGVITSGLVHGSGAKVHQIVVRAVRGGVIRASTTDDPRQVIGRSGGSSAQCVLATLIVRPDPGRTYIAVHCNGELKAAIGRWEGLDYAISLDDENVGTACCQLQGAGGAGAGLSYSGECNRDEGDGYERWRFHVSFPPLATANSAMLKTAGHYTPPARIASYSLFQCEMSLKAESVSNTR